MANDNLRPNKKLQDPEYAKELGRKAGVASGKARRRKANLRKAVEEVLSLRVPLDVMARKLESLGIEPTMEQALALQLVTNAVNKGDPRAFKVILETIGQDRTLADKAEQRSRIKRLNAETTRLEEETARRNGTQGAEDAQEQAIAIANMINTPSSERVLQDFLGGETNDTVRSPEQEAN